MVNNLPLNAGDIKDMSSIPGSGIPDSLEEGIAAHSGVLAWRIPWTEEPSGPQSMGLQRVRYNWIQVKRLSTHVVATCFAFHLEGQCR